MYFFEWKSLYIFIAISPQFAPKGAVDIYIIIGSGNGTGDKPELVMIQNTDSYICHLGQSQYKDAVLPA